MDSKEIIQQYYQSFKETDKESLRETLSADVKHKSEFAIYNNRDKMITEIWPSVGQTWAEDVKIFGSYPEYMVRYTVHGGERPARNMAEFVRFTGEKISEVEVFLGRKIEESKDD